MNHDSAKSRCAARRPAAVLAAAVASVAMLVAAAPAGAASRDFYGIVPVAGPSPEEFSTMSDAGVGTYRFQLSWAIVQPAKDSAYDFSSVDKRVGDATRAGLQPLPFIYGSPDFIGGSRRHPAVDSEEDKQEYREFATAVAERYGPGGEFWDEFEVTDPGVTPKPFAAYQILNEQNSPSYYEPKPSVKEYAEFLDISHDAITSVDSGADIVLGGMFGTPGRRQAIYSWKYLKKLYKAGAKKNFDAVALHPYSPNIEGIEAQIKLVRKEMKKAKDSKTPIWITELGWGSAGTGNHELIKSEGGQKKMLQKAFKLIEGKRGKWKIRRLMWFTWRDTGNPTDPVGVTCTWCASAGLLDENMDPKPSLDAFTRFAEGG